MSADNILTTDGPKTDQCLKPIIRITLILCGH